MSDSNTTITSEEVARRSQCFLNAITASAHEQQLPRSLVMNLLGLFARHVAELHMADGDVRTDATLRVVEQFMRGLGADAVFQKATPEEAERMIGAARGDKGPLQ